MNLLELVVLMQRVARLDPEVEEFFSHVEESGDYYAILGDAPRLTLLRVRRFCEVLLGGLCMHTDLAGELTLLKDDINTQLLRMG